MAFREQLERRMADALVKALRQAGVDLTGDIQPDRVAQQMIAELNKELIGDIDELRHIDVTLPMIEAGVDALQRTGGWEDDETADWIYQAMERARLDLPTTLRPDHPEIKVTREMTKAGSFEMSKDAYFEPVEETVARVYRRMAKESST